MTYFSIPVMVCHLITAFYPHSGPEIMHRDVGVELGDPSLHGFNYFRRMPIDTGHGFTFYLSESGSCVKAYGYWAAEEKI